MNKKFPEGLIISGSVKRGEEARQQWVANAIQYIKSNNNIVYITAANKDQFEIGNDVSGSLDMNKICPCWLMVRGKVKEHTENGFAIEVYRIAEDVTK